MKLLCTKKLKLTNGVFWLHDEVAEVNRNEAAALLSEYPKHFKADDEEAATLVDQLTEGKTKVAAVDKVFGAAEEK